jgi:hypothetical protein
VNVCGVCGQVEREREFLPLDEVVLANGLVVPACAPCWLKWPHERKWRVDLEERVA